jgi:HSP20 family protein|tara:strand:- start:10 stop:396 length:387 start_codon:yes stop_codon:yes gene_type:complete
MYGMINNSTYKIANDFAALFDNLFEYPALYNWSYDNKRPSKIEKNDKGYSAKVELPGYNKDSLSMRIEHGNLLVVRSSKEEEEDKTLYRLELTNDIDHKNIKAKSQDGVLHLTLPKLEEKKKKCIMIE